MVSSLVVDSKDDGLVTVKGSYRLANSVSTTVREVISNAGFVINVEKSRFEPSKKATWLGFDIDLEEGKIVIPKQKLDSLKNNLEHCLQCPVLSARTIASITGKILSL